MLFSMLVVETGLKRMLSTGVAGANEISTHVRISNSFLTLLQSPLKAFEDCKVKGRPLFNLYLAFKTFDLHPTGQAVILLKTKCYT